MAEIIKVFIDDVLLDDLNPIVNSLETLSRLKWQEQDLEGVCFYLESLSQLYQPDQQFIVGERNHSLSNEIFSLKDGVSQQIEGKEKRAMAFRQPEGEHFPLRFHSPALPAAVSGAVVERLGNIAILLFQADGGNNESSDIFTDSYLGVSNEQSPGIKSSNVKDKNGEGVLDGEFMQLKNEVTGENHEPAEFQKQDFMMERYYELQTDIISGEELTDVSSQMSKGDKLTYNFKRWGEGHSVNVRRGQSDEESTLDFEPSEGLAEVRLTEVWEQMELPENWYLQGDKERKQQQQGQPESEEDEHS